MSFLVAQASLCIQQFIHIPFFPQFNLHLWPLAYCLAAILSTHYFISKPPSVYMVDFVCYKPDPSCICTKETFMDLAQRNEAVSEENLGFMEKILNRSGLGPSTYVPESTLRMPPDQSMASQRKESEKVIFGAIDELIAKTRVKVEDIGIIVC
ncbi:hypothetical protein L6164_013030 [Bauhinia variegata]|uniref:Uncharacterized protein n=1 Tax=Bauhinia variegata TaxID=167791 RepID=A0ACB9PEM6_BAUVA|nr:hypothetical protein L6164_013030 [Bauhinia variegata]